MATPSRKTTDTGATVIATMHRYGISPLPRNYELVYEVLNSNNTALIREFKAFTQRPTQPELDEIGKKFLTRYHASDVIETAQDRTSEELQGMLHLLKKENSARECYSNLLDETCSRISAKNASSVEILGGIIKVLSSATGDTIEQGKSVVRELVEHAHEMENVKTKLDEYKRLANIDALTRLSNRRAFDETLAGIYNDKRSAIYHALLIADIDHFKKFNDSYGHSIGDRVLNAVSAVMKKCIRDDAFIARIGGEEFAVILYGTSLEVTMEIAERIRHTIGSTPLKDQKTGQDFGQITMSFGLCMATDASNAEELYAKADRALYAAKNLSRNCVKLYNPEMDAEMEKKWALYKG
jgi:diguanylate cyclase